LTEIRSGGKQKSTDLSVLLSAGCGEDRQDLEPISRGFEIVASGNHQEKPNLEVFK
jgi:hypothetical protein